MHCNLILHNRSTWRRSHSMQYNHNHFVLNTAPVTFNLLNLLFTVTPRTYHKKENNNQKLNEILIFIQNRAI